MTRTAAPAGILSLANKRQSVARWLGTSRMTGLAWLVVAYIVVFLINLVPAFMPPTWSILAFFLIRYDLPLLPLALGGALAASAGRLGLALASRHWGRRLLSPQYRENLVHLGTWLEQRAAWATPVAVLLYSFGPIPSNNLFMAAGLTGMRLAPIVAAFFVGRVISYTFFASSARAVVDRIEDTFVGHWGSLAALALELAALAVLVIFTRLDWPRLLHLPTAAPDAAARTGEAPPRRRGKS